MTSIFYQFMMHNMSHNTASSLVFSVIAAQSNLCHSLTVMTHLRYGLATLLPNFLMSSDDERNAVLPLLELTSNIIRESGYFHLQATKPDTIGIT